MAGEVHDSDTRGAADALQLARMLRNDEVDAAIEAGLMTFAPPADMPADRAMTDALRIIIAAQQQLRRAWRARERYRARNARLQRRADERAARRASATSTTDGAKPALPPAAAAALARAKARAAGKP